MMARDIEVIEKQWRLGFNEVSERIASLFRRDEAHDCALSYLRGLLSCVERKTSWQLAEHAGKSNPYAIQHLLGRSKWDAEMLRDELRSYVHQHLADKEGIAILDETGFLKKGKHSVGVQRQYSGTAGRVENCQIGVFLAYASNKGRTFIDRELYVPKSWCEDAALRIKSGVPEEIRFATKPQLAIKMLKRAFAHQIPIAWVTGDCVYGGDFKLRSFLASCRQPYVLMIQSTQSIFIGFQSLKVKSLACEFSLLWQRLSCGQGSKGERIYDWTLFPLQYEAPEGMQYAILLRRSTNDQTEISYYMVLMPTCTSLQKLVTVAGSRWAIEESFQTAKGEVGLDEYEVRSWHGWYRHITLALFAHAFLTVQKAVSVGEKNSSRRHGNGSFNSTGNPKNSVLAHAIPLSADKKLNIPLVSLA